MEIKEKYEITNWLDEVIDAKPGEPVKILPDVFLAKAKDQNGNIVNTYAVRHENRHDLLLIDMVYPENKATLDHYKESGYNIKAIVVTSDKTAQNSFMGYKEIAEKYDTQFYMHKLDDNSAHTVHDIMLGDEILDQFGVNGFHFPGYTGGSVMVYVGYNGALFTGHSAVGTPLEEDGAGFQRPEVNDSEDMGLMDNWLSFAIEFDHIMPAQGTPRLKLSDTDRVAIVRELSNK
jgi:hypothetical protein